MVSIFNAAEGSDYDEWSLLYDLRHIRNKDHEPITEAITPYEYEWETDLRMNPEKDNAWYRIFFEIGRWTFINSLVYLRGSKYLRSEDGKSYLRDADGAVIDNPDYGRPSFEVVAEEYGTTAAKVKEFHDHCLGLGGPIDTREKFVRVQIALDKRDLCIVVRSFGFGSVDDLIDWMARSGVEDKDTGREYRPTAHIKYKPVMGEAKESVDAMGNVWLLGEMELRVAKWLDSQKEYKWEYRGKVLTIEPKDNLPALMLKPDFYVYGLNMHVDVIDRWCVERLSAIRKLAKNERVFVFDNGNIDSIGDMDLENMVPQDFSSVTKVDLDRYGALPPVAAAGSECVEAVDYSEYYTGVDPIRAEKVIRIYLRLGREPLPSMISSVGVDRYEELKNECGR